MCPALQRLCHNDGNGDRQAVSEAFEMRIVKRRQSTLFFVMSALTHGKGMNSLDERFRPASPKRLRAGRSKASPTARPSPCRLDCCKGKTSDFPSPFDCDTVSVEGKV